MQILNTTAWKATKSEILRHEQLGWVSVVTGQWAGQPTNQCSISGKGRGLFLQTGNWAHPASYPWVLGSVTRK